MWEMEEVEGVDDLGGGNHEVDHSEVVLQPVPDKYRATVRDKSGEYLNVFPHKICIYKNHSLFVVVMDDPLIELQ